MVSCPRNIAWMSDLFYPSGYLVNWVHLRRNGESGATISRGFGDRSVVQNFQVRKQCCFFWQVMVLKHVSLMYRCLGTPNEQTWPGVTKFSDFKASFPQVLTTNSLHR